MVLFPDCESSIGPKIVFTMLILAIIAFMIFEFTMGNMGNVQLYAAVLSGIVISIIYLSKLMCFSMDYDEEMDGWGGTIVMTLTILALIPCILYYVSKSGIFYIEFIDNLMGGDEVPVDNLVEGEVTVDNLVEGEVPVDNLVEGDEVPVDDTL